MAITPIWKGSPNFDSNRTTIDRVVIHWFGAGTLEGAYQTFQKPNGTSAHYAVSDTTVWQFVAEDKVAYHAGNYAMNQRSIGIEHDANPNKPLSELSYQTSAQMLADICMRYAIPLDRQHILEHREIKATACPGTIDLNKLITLAKTIQGGTMATLLQWLGLNNEQQAIETLRAHLGENNEKCNYGSEPATGAENRGGYLGSSRREVTELKKQLATQPVPPSPLLPDPTLWVENGKEVRKTVGDTVVVTNYAKK